MDIIQLHLGGVRISRFFYLLIRKAAYENPKKLMFMESDRQNSTTTAMPYLSRGIKNKEHLQKLNLTLQGFLVNGTIFYAMINLPNHRKDSNNSITARFLTMLKYCNENNGMPPVWFFQTDNCAGENKSRIIILFICLLLMTAKCQAINLSFPWVGHSHGSVDAIFGRFSSLLRRTEKIFTFQQLKQVRIHIICHFSFCFVF